MRTDDKYKVIGLMSGTSLDGLDIALCLIRHTELGWAHAIDITQTIKYSPAWKRRLEEAPGLPGDALMELHAQFGKYLGVLVDAFITKNKVRGVDFIASHGHTIFHQPDKFFTFQLGDGYSLHAAANLPVVCDFRSLDVKLGGQGAPLVPAGDRQLFREYDVCLNLGGIANLSYESAGKRRAFDVCFANMPLNLLAAQVDLPYDKNGTMASEGEVDNKLLNELRKAYARLKKERPSLGRELFEKKFQRLLLDPGRKVHDGLCTVVESTAEEIIAALPVSAKKQTVFCTGGGAFNAYLMYRLIELGGDKFVFIRPEDDVVKFKEALVFAFLGVLRVRGEVNCLKSVTGAKADSSGGTMIGFGK